jgi:hypothetical protein
MSLQSAVSEARPNSRSLRATVPEGVVAYFDLHDGDRLDWRMEVMKGKKVVLVTKAKVVHAGHDGQAGRG